MHGGAWRLARGEAVARGGVHWRAVARGGGRWCAVGAADQGVLVPQEVQQPARDGVHLRRRGLHLLRRRAHVAAEGLGGPQALGVAGQLVAVQLGQHALEHALRRSCEPDERRGRLAELRRRLASALDLLLGRLVSAWVS